MIDISKAFAQASRSVADLFLQPGLAFYIPLYQREYSWDKENIDQLMQDIFYGVENLLTDPNKEIRFLGTIIRVTEGNPTVNLDPKDPRGLPTKIDKIIDGQQRISTISLLGCLLYQRLVQLRAQVQKEARLSDLNDEITKKLFIAHELFSVDMKIGSPARKPIVIRGSVDHWTLKGDDDDYYKSDMASYFAKVIRSIDEGGAFPPIPKKRSSESNPHVRQNLSTMTSYLNRVLNAHLVKEEMDEDAAARFPTAVDILNNIPEQYVWSYERPEMKALALSTGTDKTTLTLRSIIQLFAFCHYLFERCCVTVIEPNSEDWAFDMFQSLNATGTPLTAIETFKPLVVNLATRYDGGYQDSQVAKYYSKIDFLFNRESSASRKDKLTNEYLTAFALANSAKRLARRFSEQRKWLNDAYELCDSKTSRQEFIHRMGNLADYWINIVAAEIDSGFVFPSGCDKVTAIDKQLIPLCLRYLEQAGHKMARVVLYRFYALILRNEPQAVQNFISAVKATTAFFTLWRSARDNSGLDEAYRVLMSDNNGLPKGLSWDQAGLELNPNQLKQYFCNVLRERDAWPKDKWIARASQNLRYDAANWVCRFALFVAAHDTIADDRAPGLMKVTAPGSYRYLDYETWNSKDLRDIEHIAPRQPESAAGWDPGLYDAQERFQLVGNLTLLPAPINVSAGNKGWKEKWLYYRYLAEMDLESREKIITLASKEGVLLQPTTIDILKQSQVSHHVRPLTELKAESEWNASFVALRTERICSILWDRIATWLEPAT